MAAFALGSQWAPLERPHGSAISLHRDNDDLGRVFYNHGKSLIPDIIDRPCLRSIQAPFLLGVYLMPASAIGSSYVYMGLALRKALAFDLHIDQDDQVINDREREVRRRLWWSIYSLERCTTVKLNRPRSVGIDKYDNVQFQMAYTRLIRILDQIAEPGGSLNETTEQSRAESWESDLRQWKKSLPPDFKIDTMHPKDSRYRTIFHLYLNYYYAWITIGKVALVTVARTSPRSHLQPWSKPSEASDLIVRQSRSCAKAARKLLLLFENLTSTGNITRFSFTDFQGCSIATIVTLVAGIMERDSGYEARVTFGLDCLRKMATGNITAKMGVKFVEAVQSITNEAAAKIHRASSIHTESTEDAQSSASASEYHQWAAWHAEMEPSQTEEQGVIPYRGIEVEPNVPYSNTPLLQLGQSNVPNTSGWKTPNDQNFSETSLLPQDLAHGSTMAWGIQSTDDDHLSALQNDDPAFLMGLTGTNNIQNNLGHKSFHNPPVALSSQAWPPQIKSATALGNSIADLSEYELPGWIYVGTPTVPPLQALMANPYPGPPTLHEPASAVEELDDMEPVLTCSDLCAQLSKAASTEGNTVDITTDSFLTTNHPLWALDTSSIPLVY
ncbi:hypothetical protein PENARI_c009G07944 [Penicillium arizonense]|uniref:Xylanolytic transcriptional activator regulatory domain-containing protein n=1 Tax=Penicillium arizonense TaxID=1835702 RepID=A0A1F5LIK4_PENAI|nr:hypothetical protein PENARI_c009G07944 [Penicillium arizonense]OGE52916.1 hypothetical protein PENARI_c009G07944 [Penicillium arizonense]